MTESNYDLRLSETWIESACDLLRRHSKLHLCPLVKIAYEAALPRLREGIHISPVHHVGRVTELLVRILLCEGVSDRLLAQGCVAIIWHDAGNCGEPRGERKITSEEVKGDPAKRVAAQQQRLRHARASGQLVRGFLATQTAWEFSEQEQHAIRWVVEHHDDPSIAELTPAADRSGLLFGVEQRLAAAHREADRLGMLTVEGVATDLRRKARRNQPWNAQAQITHNVIRHWEERHLYEEALGDHVTDLGFTPNGAFYRTSGGQSIFLELQDAARAIRNQEWVKRVIEEA